MIVVDVVHTVAVEVVGKGVDSFEVIYVVDVVGVMDSCVVVDMVDIVCMSGVYYGVSMIDVDSSVHDLYCPGY